MPAPLDFDSHVRQLLADLEQRHLLRAPRSVSSPQGPELDVQGRRVIGLCSNNYLGLANDPRIRAAAAAALDRDGFGAAASRHISGTHTLHVELERALASFVGLPSALLFSTGYAANVGAIQALAGRETAIFSDRLNHASLIDGARLSRAQVFIYDHLDLDQLEQLLARPPFRLRARPRADRVSLLHGGRRRGPPRLRALATQFEAGLVIDEAHALGISGPHGSGFAKAAAVQPDLLIGTLGKAFGCAGAFAAGSPDDHSTAREPGTQLHLLDRPAPEPGCSRQHRARARRSRPTIAASSSLSTPAELRRGLAALGLNVLPGSSPIIPVVMGSPERTMAFSANLLEHGVFVHGVRPPTVPLARADSASSRWPPTPRRTSQRSWPPSNARCESPMIRSAFITGVSTAVGKTYLSRGLTRALEQRGRAVCALKPLETGVTNEPSDAVALARACGRPELAQASGLYRHPLPLAPYAASPPDAALPHPPFRSWPIASASWPPAATT